MSGVDDREWLSRAACADYPPDWWFPEERTPEPARMAKVREVCAGCSVRRECLDYGLRADKAGPRGGHGIWAGLSEGQRVSLKRTTCVGCRWREDPAVLWERASNWRPTGVCAACDTLRATFRAKQVSVKVVNLAPPTPFPPAPPPLPPDPPELIPVKIADQGWWDQQTALLRGL
jgi:WhiB family redox-sensing transcriptional regulator